MLTVLRNKVVLQKLSVSQDVGGTFTESWTTNSVLYANVKKDANSNETFDKRQQFTNYTIRMRVGTTTSQIFIGDRFLFKNKILRINAISDNADKNRFFTVKAVEEVGS